MSKADRERKLSARRNATHRRAFGGQIYAKARPYPCADVLDKQLLVCAKPIRVEIRRILLQPQGLVGDAVNADNHRRRRILRFKKPTPLRYQLTVTGEYDRLRWVVRNVHRHLSAIIVVERLGAKFARDPVSPGLGRSRANSRLRRDHLRTAGRPAGVIPLSCDPSVGATTASDVTGANLTATCADGTLTVAAQTARIGRITGAILPSGAMLCAAGTRDGEPCASDDDCPQGVCTIAVGVCGGGSDDGLLCDCPGGTCVAQPSCGADVLLGICSGGLAHAQCCDTSFNCAGHRPCAATQRVCSGGLAKGMPCLSNNQCSGASCTSSGRRCLGGDFDRVACVDAGDCPRGACLAPGESIPPVATATPTPAPTAPAALATSPVDPEDVSS